MNNILKNYGQMKMNNVKLGQETLLFSKPL